MSDRNLNPHAEARVAMALWSDRYSKQKLGCMDFYDGLTAAQKSTCAQIVDGIIYADRADGRTPPPSPIVMGTRIATAEDHNAAFDPADEALGGAFKAGFKEGWIYAKMDADGDRYQEMAEEYGLAVDTAPQECWDAHREKFFAMLPLAAIPEVGAAIGDVEAEIASVVQSLNEWDDRTSPDDYPEHLIITSEELTLILRNFAAAISASEVKG